MFKKLIIITVASILIISCGKKGDPVFNENNQNSKILINQMSRSV